MGDITGKGKENQMLAGNKKREGSVIRMELICVSPSKSSKYGSQKVVSPVRRSNRIQQQREDGDLEPTNVQRLLKESSYHYVPNPNLSTSQNKGLNQRD